MTNNNPPSAADLIDDLMGKTEELEQEAHFLRETTDRKIRRATREFRVLAALIGLLLVGVLVVGVGQWKQASNNGNVLNGIEDNQEDLDALVAFVEKTTERQGDNNSQTREVFIAVFQTRDILCAEYGTEYPEYCEVPAPQG